MTIKEFMYRHYVIGMFKDYDGRLYEILAPAPDYHFDKKSAQKDTFWEYRFISLECPKKEQLLGIYEKKFNGPFTHAMDDERFIKAGGMIYVLKNGISKNGMVFDDEDFEICNKSFDEMFSQLKPSQPIFIKEVGNVIKTFGILDMKMDDKSLKADCLNV